VAKAALAEGSPGLSRFELRLFTPLMPMLAQSAEDVGVALGRLGRAGFEYKLDGARVQVHRRGDEVRVFSRASNDVTGAVPEVVAAVRALPGEELILDGETLALGPDGRPRPFQVTMRRFGRRRDDPKLREALPLSVLFFDCLRLEGETLLERSGAERSEALARALPPELRVPRLVTDDGEQAAAFAEAAFAEGHEGLVAKSLASPYEAGGRGSGWLKLKRAHTLDLVVLAAEWGSGRRRGRLSNLHLGARDAASGGFVMLGKTFKGLTDALLEWQTRRLLELEAAREGHVVRVRPELVVEIAFDGLQESQHYPGGLALRFARVKRYREDKPASQADSFETVKALFAGQPG
jgi:DNA ligase-1